MTAVLIGFAAGVVAGMLGVGGGILFVPALTLALGLSQVDAEATSLLAIIGVSVLGTIRQSRYGNVRMRDGLLVGGLGIAGVAAGVSIANAVGEDTLRTGFAVVMLVVAAQLARRALRPAA
jgi:uncharacterized membrane protein YfcA